MTGCTMTDNLKHTTAVASDKEGLERIRDIIKRNSDIVGSNPEVITVGTAKNEYGRSIFAVIKTEWDCCYEVVFYMWYGKERIFTNRESLHKTVDTAQEVAEKYLCNPILTLALVGMLNAE
jgi:hypothetical protein